MPTGGTIAAICTPPGNAARAMIRISGEQAQACARELCTLEHPERGVYITRIRLGESDLPAIAMWFPKGASYTGQDSLELSFVGNAVVAGMVLDACISIEGVRPAEPGEFSARAYLGGRLSLQQAEGIALRIAARQDDALAAASALLDGSHGRVCNSWVDQLTGMLALVEAGVDFTDQDDVVAITPKNLNKGLGELLDEIQAHLGARAGHQVHADLPTAVLVGEPNAGKSTLMNALLGVKRVMVSDQAGTTRDAIIERLNLSQALPGAGAVLLCDLPGLGEFGIDAIDHAAQERAREQIASADVIIWCDPSGRFDDSRPMINAGLPTVRVRTKSDLVHNADTGNELSVCALDGSKLDVLKRAISDAACARTGEGVGAFVPRHRRSMVSAAEGIRAALAEFEPTADSIEMPELVASGLRDALDALGELAGEVTPDDVIGRVFATFCVGK